MKNKNIGLVLSGGGVNGFVYVGIMKYLEEQGITPKIVGGTSVGSIFGAMISAGYTWIEMRNYVIELETRINEVKDINWKNISKSTFTANINHTNGLIKGNRIKGEISNLLKTKGISKFNDLIIPYYLHIVDLNTAEDICISSLDDKYKNKGVLDYIRASISIPGVFPPYEIEGKYYVDGGVRSNYPILSAPEIAFKNNIELDAVISINIFPEFNKEDNFQEESFLEIMMRSISISILDQYDSDTKIFKEKYSNIEYIPININKIFKDSILTAKISNAIDYGYNEIKSQLEK